MGPDHGNGPDLWGSEGSGSHTTLIGDAPQVLPYLAKNSDIVRSCRRAEGHHLIIFWLPELLAPI